jgi:hypothetical protein
MKGERLYVLSGLDVEEGEVYEVQADGALWIKRDGRIGARYRPQETYPSLDEAVAVAQNHRARHIRRLVREIERMALNASIKVRLLKKTKQQFK